MTVDLKPCPFCGDTDPQLRDMTDPVVSCECCGAEGPTAIDATCEDHDQAVRVAVDMWNARAGEPAPTTKGN